MSRDPQHEQLRAENEDLRRRLAEAQATLEAFRTGAADAVNSREARAAEAASRHSEERFRRLADALPQIVWMARPDGTFDYFNERWYEFTGFPRGQTGDDSWKPILHPDDVRPCVERWYRSVRSGEDYQIQYRFKDRRAGGYRWFLGRAVPVRDERGRIVRWFGTCTDIDDQKRGEEKLAFLAEASATLAVLVDPESTLGNVARQSVPFFADWCEVYLTDERRRVRLVGAHAEPTKEAALRRLWEGYPPCWDSASPVARVLKTGRPELVAEVTDALAEKIADDAEHRRLLRELDPKSYVVVPLTVRGATVGALAFFVSLSGRRYEPADLDLAEDLARRAAVAIDNARLYHEAREADRRKDEFLAMLAHELRNPLAPVRNALHIIHMRGNERRQAVHNAHEVIERQVEHMVRLVDDLLDVSRITRGKINLQREPVDVAQIVARAVEGSRPLIDARRHTLEVAAEGGLWVEGDATRLAQVLWNLLNNAAKYTPEGGRIRLAVERAAGAVLLRVRDTGMGMPREVLPKVFDLFTQAERTLDRAQGGLGIGLTLVRQLTEMHGGTVEAHSDGPGKGSEFVVRLPLLAAGAEAPADADGPRLRPTPRHRVLVVDDNRDSADSLATLLRLVGNDVRTAYDGRQALEVAAQYRPEMVLLDIGLPVMNGYEVARQLRTEPAYGHPVLTALTGYSSEEDRRRSLAAGFDHHMVKPVDFAALQEVLASLEETPSGA
jgi:PAS domain S-box-containing protein